MCGNCDSGYDLNVVEMLQRNCVPYHGYGEKSNYWLVTYSRSQVQDESEFYRCLRNSIECRIPWSRDNKQAAVGIFGCKQADADAVHYRVAIQFSMRVDWRNAKEAFTVYIDDRKQVPDTFSVCILRMKPHRSQYLWLEEVQSCLAKSGGTFGAWIDPLPNARKRSNKSRRTKSKKVAKRMCDSSRGARDGVE